MRPSWIIALLIASCGLILLLKENSSSFNLFLLSNLRPRTPEDLIAIREAIASYQVPPRVDPNRALSRIPRIRNSTSDALPPPSCLKLPSNGIDDDCWNALRRDQYLRTLDERYQSPDEELERFKPNSNWQIFDLITPTYHCDANSLQRIGASGDGGKWLCGPIRVLGPKCVVFSLGSNNQFDFEEAIHAHTNGECEIHTFDCTGEWSNPKTSFHPWCLGGFDGKDENGRTFKRLSTAAREIGVTSISLLKMDIEHGEYEVFEGFKFEEEEFLPDQILFELHTLFYPTKTSKHKSDWPRTIMDLVRDIDEMGYSFAFQEKNLFCPACSEYVIVRDRKKLKKRSLFH
ncbi:hypothetical protein SELMODRAFT_425378 [Selaginella moellendorffii]|uniref:Methyltransferase domain-containing protein n=1 Tax=Selaginella moellendorffii TaxID=88036 RepID=D8SSX2_SELML|nr:uncharacterized protein LOC9649839 [Selaginella moellendorffii]EFJ12555.1 hypothetical protein SELMODRAFT_425378 [Selaginella moellendorffii]|eukprot:XP_002986346.1 uncharacterized protein LOC9649839 [Selaginella moellendorffii]